MKTIKSYLNQLKKLSEIDVQYLKGYDELEDEQKESLFFLEGEIHNAIRTKINETPERV